MCLEYLERIATHDVDVLREKEKSYGDSWKRRGGVGAFMMLARKWDRIEVALNPERVPGDQREAPLSAVTHTRIPAFDIFRAVLDDTRPEGILDDIQDLRRYLLLVEAEVRAQNEDKKMHRDAATLQYGKLVEDARSADITKLERSKAGGTGHGDL